MPIYIILKKKIERILIMFFIGGIQLFCTGIVGQYLAKVYIETKKRPVYIIKEEI